MTHLPALILDLAMILVTAAFVTVLFRRLRQPVVLGYLIAGILTGPYVAWLPTVKDTRSIHIWAELGIIFLMFGVGLDFSFKKLKQVGRPAFLTAMVEIPLMIAAGYTLGRALGWNWRDCLFLGGIVAISSTAIIVRAVDELKLKGQRFVSLVYGVLLLEDLAAVLLLVTLSTVAASRSLEGSELLFATGKLGFFLITTFLVGTLILPMILKAIRKWLTAETLLIVSLGLCLLMVTLASAAGFSAALGAFLMGSLLSETQEKKRIEELLAPLKDLFSAVFFVSIGMMIEPALWLQHWEWTIWTALIIVVGKFITNTSGMLLGGEGLKPAVQAGLSMTQIGEFSFLIATQGVLTKVTSDSLYSITVSAAVVTIFLTPYLMQSAPKVTATLQRWLPARLHDRLDGYRTSVTQSGDRGLLSLIWRAYGVKLLLNSVMVLAIGLAVRKIIFPWEVRALGSVQWAAVSSFGMALLFGAPFLAAIILMKPNEDSAVESEKWARLRSVQWGIWVVRVLLVVFLVLLLGSGYAGVRTSMGSFVVAGIVATFLLSHFSDPLYRRMERQFLKHLEGDEESAVKRDKRPQLAPWDASLFEFVLSPDSGLCGKTLLSSGLREKQGVTVALIERGSRKILAPGREDLLMPYDRLFVIGTDKQLTLVRQLIEGSDQEPLVTQEATVTYGLKSLLLAEGNSFTGMTIRECGIREKVRGLIVGIERKDSRILNPESHVVLQEGDLVWLVGDLGLLAKVAS